MVILKNLKLINMSSQVRYVWDMLISIVILQIYNIILSWIWHAIIFYHIHDVLPLQMRDFFNQSKKTLVYLSCYGSWTEFFFNF